MPNFKRTSAMGCFSIVWCAHIVIALYSRNQLERRPQRLSASLLNLREVGCPMRSLSCAVCALVRRYLRRSSCALISLFRMLENMSPGSTSIDDFDPATLPRSVFQGGASEGEIPQETLITPGSLREGNIDPL